MYRLFISLLYLHARWYIIICHFWNCNVLANITVNILKIRDNEKDKLHKVYS